MIERIRFPDGVMPITLIVKKEMTSMVLDRILNHKDWSICPFCEKKLIPGGTPNFYYCQKGHDLSESGVYHVNHKYSNDLMIVYFCAGKPNLEALTQFASNKKMIFVSLALKE